MATFTTDMFMTLDGYGTGSEPYRGKGGPELRARRAEAFGDPDQVLVYGANTYRLTEKFAPDMSDVSREPLMAARKIVISRTLEEPLALPNSTLIAEDALEAVPRLKEESDVSLRCHGSIAMNKALLAAGLVDRLEVTVFPVLSGAGGENPIFGGLPELDLELVDTQVFDGRVHQLTYEPRLR